MVQLVSCSSFNSLSTSTSTGISSAHSSVASLSTLTSDISSGVSSASSAVSSLSTSTSSAVLSLSTSTSTGLSTAFSSVSSLSTVVDSKADLVGGLVPANQLPSYVDEVFEFATLGGFPAVGESGKIYLDASTDKSYRWSGTSYVEIGTSYALTARDEGTLLTTATTEINFVGAGVSANSAGGMVTVNVPGPGGPVAPGAPLTGTTPPVAPPPLGASMWYTDTVLNETWMFDGSAWRLITGLALDEFGATGLVYPAGALVIYEFVMPRNATASVSAQALMTIAADPVAPNYLQAFLSITRNGSQTAVQSVSVGGEYGPGDGLRLSASRAVGGYIAGDVIRAILHVASTQAGLPVNLQFSSFQILFEA